MGQFMARSNFNLMGRKNKKAAIELSVGTIVIIVIAMTMLIMGIVLVRNIFSGAKDVSDITNNQVRSELIGMFAKEGSNLAIQLGSDKTLKIKAGSIGNVNIGAIPKQGGTLNSLGDLKFKIDISRSNNDCIYKGVTETEIKNWFQHNLDNKNEFDRLDSNTLFATIKIAIPEGTITCTQKFKVTVYDERAGASTIVGIDSFFVEVIRKGIF